MILGWILAYGEGSNTTSCTLLNPERPLTTIAEVVDEDLGDTSDESASDNIVDLSVRKGGPISVDDEIKPPCGKYDFIHR